MRHLIRPAMPGAALCCAGRRCRPKRPRPAIRCCNGQQPDGPFSPHCRVCRHQPLRNRPSQPVVGVGLAPARLAQAGSRAGYGRRGVFQARAAGGPASFREPGRFRPIPRANLFRWSKLNNLVLGPGLWRGPCWCLFAAPATTRTSFYAASPVSRAVEEAVGASDRDGAAGPVSDRQRRTERQRRSVQPVNHCRHSHSG